MTQGGYSPVPHRKPVQPATRMPLQPLKLVSGPRVSITHTHTHPVLCVRYLFIASHLTRSFFTLLYYLAFSSASEAIWGNKRSPSHQETLEKRKADIFLKGLPPSSCGIMKASLRFLGMRPLSVTEYEIASLTPPYAMILHTCPLFLYSLFCSFGSS